MDKVSTQAMSYDGSDSCFSTTNYHTQHQPFQPLNEYTCFTKMEREELKQMMREVMEESILTVNRGESNNQRDVIERVRDDYHHGGLINYPMI